MSHGEVDHVLLDPSLGVGSDLEVPVVPRICHLMMPVAEGGLNHVEAHVRRGLHRRFEVASEAVPAVVAGGI